MATRRSRLQVKPNLGGKARSLPVRKETSQPSPRKVNVKNKEDDLTSPLKSSISSSGAESALPESTQHQTKSLLQDPEDVANITTAKKDIAIIELNGVGSISKGPNIANKAFTGENTPGCNNENENINRTNNNEDQGNQRESFSDRVNVNEGDVIEFPSTAVSLVSAETKDHDSGIDNASTQASRTSENANLGKFDTTKSTGETDEVKSPNDVAKPKSRNRFPKPKPNISEAGRPKARPPITKLEPSKVQTGKPVDVLKNRVVQSEDVIKNRMDTEPVQRSASVSDNEQGKEQPKPKTETAASSRQDDVTSIADPIPVKKQTKTGVKRRKKRTIFDPCDKPPDHSKMRMCDLIYWNPSNNPMKPSLLPLAKVDRTEESPASQKLAAATEEENIVDDPVAKENEEEEENVAVPQVTIGPDGSIIINEDTLVIPNPEKKLTQLSDADIVNETESFVTYSTFKKKVQNRCWTDKETTKFFQALSMIGTDFGLMLNLFPKRTRRELKNKFKREEKRNKLLVDKAIAERCHFDISLFQQPPEIDEPPIKKPKIKRRKSKDSQFVEAVIKPPASKKPKTRRKRKVDYYEETDSEDDNIEDDDLVDTEAATKSDENVNKKVENNRPVAKTSTSNVITSKEVTNKEMDEILMELRNIPPPSPVYGQSREHITSPFVPRNCSNIPQSNNNIIEDGIAMMPMSPYTSDQIQSMISPVGFLSPKPSPRILTNNSPFFSPKMDQQRLAATKSPLGPWIHQTETSQALPDSSLLSESPHYVLVANSPQNKQETVIHVYMLSPTHQTEPQQMTNTLKSNPQGLSMIVPETEQTFIVSPSSSGHVGEARLKHKTSTGAIGPIEAIQEVTVISDNVDNINLQTGSNVIISDVESEVIVGERNFQHVAPT